jgi:NRAMP (natural resistance-associated macrophage protein)-like metal ion transporter
MLIQSTSILNPTSPLRGRSKLNWLLLLSVLGPGLMVMLADTDSGSIITAAQSGAQWGYQLLAIQFILMPILYITQELTVRLGIITGRGHAELIKSHFGKLWAWISVSTLAVGCMGAIITEFSGIASAGALLGVSVKTSVGLTILLLSLLAWTGSYKSVERIALAIGSFELVFLGVAWHAHPSMAEMLHGLTSVPFNNKGYWYLIAANIGAVIMPWMVFYQQSAVIDKSLTPQHLRLARLDTAIGAIITQAIMAAVLIATAATIGKTHPRTSLDTVQQISSALTPALGENMGRLAFCLGMLGAALIATIVVSLALAWGVGELTGYRRSLQNKPSEAPWFYSIYTLGLVLGGLLVTSNINLVKLNVAVEVMNAMLLPIVLGFLFFLARKTLPEAYRLKGFYAIVVGILFLVTSVFGLFSGLWGMI